MLRFFAKLERSRNLVLLVFCAILLIGLVAFYAIPNQNMGAGTTNNSSEGDTVVAKVGSQEIKLREFSAQVAQMASFLSRGQNLPLATLQSLGIGDQALDQLISSKLVLDQASNLNLTGSDTEVFDVLKRQYTDPNTGVFIGKEEYVRRLRLQGFDVGAFEQDRRNEITVRKIRSYLTSAEQVSDRDIEERFKKDQTKIDLVYALVELDKIRTKFKPSDAELKTYYDAHQKEFTASQPTRKVEYVFIASKDAEKTITIPDSELRTQYDANKQKEKRVSIIRIDRLADADYETVNNKVLGLAKRAKGDGMPQEDFAALAKGNSMDTASKAKGGDLGWIKKDPNKTSDWKQRVYTSDLKVGTIDGPFSEGVSQYLMKVTEERDIPFEEMRPTLIATAKNNRSFQKSNELAQKVYEKATEGKDLLKGAETVAAELKVSAASMIKTTAYFKDGDSLPSLGDSVGYAVNQAFENAVKDLKKGDVGTPVSIPGGYAVPKVVDILDNGAAMTFDQARNQVEEKLRREREPDLAKARAQELAQAKDAASLESMLKAEGLTIKKDSNFNTYQWPGASQGGLQSQNLATAMALNLKDGEVNRTPVKVGASYLVFAATKRTDADLTKLAAERETLRQTVIGERQNIAYETFIKETRKRYDAEGKIKIYKDRIDKFFASAAAQQ
ncbi:MAG: peptidyl-prolyl cis-trans isomerase [Blastocatellia bacterium]